jgi:uncharacterized protein
MKRLQELISLVRPYYNSSDPAHDWAHIGRVAATAKKLCEDQPVNVECVLAGVYCHDLVNLPKDHADRKNASTLAASEAESLLVICDFSPDEISLIKKTIVEHSFSKGERPSCLEAAIVQDADRLDALGAIGILRCAAVNTRMQSSFYDSLDPMAELRELDDRKFMLDHYSVKLFKLPDLMNTSQGKSLAHKRVNFMKEFIQELMGEIQNK